MVDLKFETGGFEGKKQKNRHREGDGFRRFPTCIIMDFAPVVKVRLDNHGKMGIIKARVSKQSGFDPESVKFFYRRKTVTLPSGGFPILSVS